MVHRLLADLLLVVHLGFIAFVVAGGLLVFRWRGVAWFHVPAVVWGALLELMGWICPLTPLENALRARAGITGYSTGFIDHYLLPVVYPAELSRELHVVLGVAVLAVNGAIYAQVIRRRAGARAVSARGVLGSERWVLACLAALAVPLGVATKFYSGPGAGWAQAHGGGIVYEIFWVLLVLSLWPRFSPLRAAFAVLVVTTALEFLQLWHPPFLEAVRGTFLGHALIGNTFSWWDLPHYPVGCVAGAWIARLVLSKAADSREVFDPPRRTG